MKGEENSGDPEFSGYYLATSYFLTGEHRPYRKSTAVLDKVQPKRGVLDKARGIGARELTTRFSHLDLTDRSEGVNGGELDTYTAGLNWYLGPHIRVMFNYVYADPAEKHSGDAHIVQTRVQIVF